MGHLVVKPQGATSTVVGCELAVVEQNRSGKERGDCNVILVFTGDKSTGGPSNNKGEGGGNGTEVKEKGANAAGKVGYASTRTGQQRLQALLFRLLTATTLTCWSLLMSAAIVVVSTQWLRPRWWR
ncbi:unnamed protein product [Lactuca saligna]|uniref:Uncharacterized protein n=1 Tax=Lactuca saligna TaxID=75948 RepID=A0AA35ZFH0_LACSI|nr:unnamed protein product [Lactuca saligna]